MIHPSGERGAGFVGLAADFMVADQARVAVVNQAAIRGFVEGNEGSFFGEAVETFRFPEQQVYKWRAFHGRQDSRWEVRLVAPSSLFCNVLSRGLDIPLCHVGLDLVLTVHLILSDLSGPHVRCVFQIRPLVHETKHLADG